jgi:hypothetical protein
MTQTEYHARIRAVFAPLSDPNPTTEQDTREFVHLLRRQIARDDARRASPQQQALPLPATKSKPRRRGKAR